MESVHARLEALVRGIPSVMLTTIGEGGVMHSRPMAAPHMDERGHLYFFMHAESQKSHEIARNQQVEVLFVDSRDARFVVVQGWAHIVRDRALAARFWDDRLHAWLPGGPSDPSILLLHVVPQRISYWDNARRQMVVIAMAQSCEEDEAQAHWEDRTAEASPSIETMRPVDEATD